MHGAERVSPGTASCADEDKVTPKPSLGGPCRFICNSIGTVISNHRFPASGPEACRQVASNLRNFLDV